MRKIFTVLAVFALSTSVALAAYPDRDITNAVVWGAGGGTDVVNRTIMAEMSKILGVNIFVINRSIGQYGRRAGYACKARDNFSSNIARHSIQQI
jgi:tripartite-type tricarboxylate transporter receptor subunit TctC